MTEQEIQCAMAMRLLAKAIHRLQRVGLKRDAEQLLEEAKSFGIEIQIRPDPTIQDN